MPSDLRNSTMAKGTGLIFSLFDVASAREVSFAIPLYMQCILHECTSILLCVPFIFGHHEKCWFCGTEARDGFYLLQKSSAVATLITKVLFKQLLIRTIA